MLQKLQNRALRLALNRDSRHNVWELHHEALTPMLEMRRECHLKNLMYKRKNIPDYVQIPNRQLRLYEAPVLRIDNSGWSVKSTAPINEAWTGCSQRTYYMLHILR